MKEQTKQEQEELVGLGHREGGTHSIVCHVCESVDADNREHVGHLDFPEYLNGVPERSLPQIS